MCLGWNLNITFPKLPKRFQDVVMVRARCCEGSREASAIYNFKEEIYHLTFSQRQHVPGKKRLHTKPPRAGSDAAFVA